jgi:hypothetical protein
MSFATLRLRYLVRIGLFLPLAAACGKSTTTNDVQPQPDTRSLPTCPNGDFCVQSAGPPAGSAAPAPYGRCAATATHPDDAPDSATAISYRQVNFSEDRTKTAMAKDPKACCYTWFIPCPGGRAFRDCDGAPRVASTTRRADWTHESLAIDLELSASERAARADHWTKEALFEHASVASFAQLTLDLLAFGAPPELVEEAQRAALDEVRHAKIAFALASAYAGQPIGPGALETSPARASSLADLARSTFRDACVGETIAAASLRDRARSAEDPTVARALDAIAEDEERHAELAWSIVAWAIATGGSDVARAIGDARLAALNELPRRDELARSVLLDVIVPCADAVLTSA